MYQVEAVPAKRTMSYKLNDIPSVVAHMAPEVRLVTYSDPQSPGADKFRYLRMKLRDLSAMRPLRSVLITSAVPGEGKSTVAMNLATCLAEHGRRDVLLIEGDVYHPTIAESLSIQKGPGLAECLERRLDPFKQIKKVDPFGWYLLPAGVPVGPIADILDPEAVSLLLGSLYAAFEWIVIDSPPLIPLTDTIQMSSHTDGTLLVVRADQTEQQFVESALRLLGPQRTIGIILNGCNDLNEEYSKYYQYYKGKAE